MVSILIKGTELFLHATLPGAEHTTSLTFYGGVGEIGGNKILLKDKDTQVFFDFGMSIGMKKRYYSMPFLSPHSERSLLAFGILPPIEGIYSFDEKERSIDAVFLSHSHSDQRFCDRLYADLQAKNRIVKRRQVYAYLPSQA